MYNKILTFLIFTFGFGIITSISLAQGSLAALVIVLSIDFHKQRKSLNKNDFFQKIKRHKDLLLILLAWVLLRLIHIFISENPVTELVQFREVWLLLEVPVVFYIIKKGKLKLLITSLIIGAFIVTGYTLYEYSTGVYDVFDENKRAGRLGRTHHLTYAGILLLLIPFVTGLFLHLLRNKNYILSGIVIILVGMIAPSVFFNASKGAILILPLLLSIMAIFILKKKVILLLPFLITAPLILNINTDKVANRFQHILPRSAETHDSTSEIRRDLWIAGFNIWLEHPLLGTGDADFTQIYPEYRVEGAVGPASGSGSHMHNDLFNTLVLYGSIGFSIHLLFYIFPLFLFIRYYSIISTSRYYYLVMGVVASVLAMALIGLSQCHFTDEEVQMLFWVVFGLSTALINKIRIITNTDHETHSDRNT